MKILNLVYPEKGDVKFKINSYPDGQKDLIIDYRPVIAEKTSYLVEKVQIKARLNNFEDLNLIITANSILKRLGVREVHLYAPYMLGARSDRQFEQGGPSYLVDIVAPILNSQGFESITVLDAHSDVSSACIKNLRVADNHNLVAWAISKIYDTKIGPDRIYALVSPDAGALKKIYKLADYLGPQIQVLLCSKSRDSEGKLSRLIIPQGDWFNITSDLILVDDIIDGGRAVLNIAKAFRDAGFKGRLFLIVTHGIFSAGFSELEKYFEGIYCTNSYKDKEDFDLKSGDITSIRQAKFIETKLKQLNVF